MISKFSVKKPYTVIVAVVLVIILGVGPIYKDEYGLTAKYGSALCNCYDYLPRGKS